MANGNTLQNAVNWLKSQGYLQAVITNREIAKGMDYTEASFSRVWQGGEPSPKFIRDFWNAYLKQHDVRWEDFESGPPIGKLSPADLQQIALKDYATIQVLMEQMKSLHDKIDNLTKLIEKK